MVQLNLYSTSHCHLCEEAESLIVNLSEKYDIQWQVIEISENDELLECYGLKIPVVKHMGNHKEIYWPFSKMELEQFVASD